MLNSFLESVVDKIIVLGLLKNKSTIETKFQNIFNEKNFQKTEFYLVPGVGSRMNNASMNAKLPDILRHTATNKISEDIFYNHIDIVKKYYEKNDTDSNRILILEEDCEFDTSRCSSHEKNQKKITDFLVNPASSWDVLFLGYTNWPLPFSRPVIDRACPLNLIIPFSPLTAHAYILNRTGMEKILQAAFPYLEARQSASLANHPPHIDKFYASLASLKNWLYTL